MAADTAMGGAPETDPNAAEMFTNGVVTFTNVGGSSPPPPPSGTSTIVLHVSEDAWNGDAQFVVSVDGVQQGDVRTATASHTAGAVQDITITGDFGSQEPGPVDVTFVNDAWGGRPIPTATSTSRVSTSTTSISMGTPRSTMPRTATRRPIPLRR
jgi:hypothetical protein